MNEYQLKIRLRTDATPEEIEKWLARAIEGRTLDFYGTTLEKGWDNDSAKIQAAYKAPSKPRVAYACPSRRV